MKRSVLTFVALLLAAPLPVAAQLKSDEQAAGKLPQALSDAWARHDGHELAKIMADDVDFVTVGATRLLSGRFQNSTIAPLRTEVRFLRPEIAVVQEGRELGCQRRETALP